MSNKSYADPYFFAPDLLGLDDPNLCLMRLSLDKVESTLLSIAPDLIQALEGGNRKAESILGVCSDAYAGVLKYLSEPGCDLGPTEACDLLFRAKALKKWRFTSKEYTAKRKLDAIAGFADRDRMLGAEVSVPRVYHGMRRLLERFLPEVSIDDPDLASKVTGRFGPGACAEHYSRIRRFQVLDEWLRDPHWPEVPLSAGSCADHTTVRLAAVPKDWNKDRLITVEPAYSTFVQQYVRRLLLESVHRGPLSGTAQDQLYVDAPECQQGLALLASQNSMLATVDLSNASDGISWEAVQAVFPSWVIALLEVSRTPNYTSGDGVKKLHMYAGMGNATTFVVETLFFLAYVIAYCEALGVRWSLRDRRRIISVFGDDIVCPSEFVDKYLSKYGCEPCFNINTSKSFSGYSPLRESCGIFAYKGYDITVPKIDGYGSDWSGRLGVCELHNSICQTQTRFLQSLHEAPESMARVRRLIAETADENDIPNWDMHVRGYPHICDYAHRFSALPELRYNQAYQRREARLLVSEQRTLRFNCSDRGALRYGRWFLNAWFCGMIEQDSNGFVSMPVNGTRLRRRWLPVEGA